MKKTREDVLNDLFASIVDKPEVAEISRHMDGERIYIKYPNGQEFVADVQHWHMPPLAIADDFSDEEDTTELRS